MTRPEIRTLVVEGNAIECHTWDHSNFNKYQGADWVLQLDKPKKLLEKLTGKSVEYFAFPYGLWNAKGLPELHQHGYKMAFQLSTKRDRGDPLMTVRRILDCGYWSVAEFSKNIREDFNTPRPILFKKQTTSR
jgi:peptidoglycan/xylan/chitin deacetylase (PgdA/CDA1 family)